MKPLYVRLKTIALSLTLLIASLQTSYAQCPNGSPMGNTAFDTTIATPEGVNSIQVKFPQFDPSQGMVTCVRLCITITGVVDSVSVENNSTSAQTANVYYIRTDQITGPGLTFPLTNSINHHYGPYNLAGTDGVPGSGTDFLSIVRDTVLNAVQSCRVLSDSATLSQFYGSDSVAYTYNISAFTNISCTGGNYNSTIATSAFVNFRFEYCTCPSTVLPLNVRSFNVNKLAPTKAQLDWSGYDDAFGNYHYEAQVSRNGSNFTSIGSLPKNLTGTDPYRVLYTAPNGENGLYYFRIKQVYSNGYVRYSNIKQVTLGNSAPTKFSVYPNPSSGVVGIKFDNNSSGHFNVQIFNTQGQLIRKQDVLVTGSDYVQVTKMGSGVYWLRLTDNNTGEFCVTQLLIK